MEKRIVDAGRGFTRRVEQGCTEMRIVETLFAQQWEMMLNREEAIWL